MPGKKWDALGLQGLFGILKSPRWQDVSRASERVSKHACVCLHSERQLSAVQRAGKAGPGAGSLSQLPFMHWQLETPSVPKSYSKGEVVGQLTTSQEPGKLAPLAFQQLGQLFCCVYPSLIIWECRRGP